MIDANLQRRASIWLYEKMSSTAECGWPVAVGQIASRLGMEPSILLGLTSAAQKGSCDSQ